MDYRLTTVIGLKTTFSRISNRCGFMNEHVVPRLIPFRLGFVGFVPIFISRTLGVMRYHHATIKITNVSNQITRRELG